MRDQELVNALRRLKVEIGSLACLGCGHEHNWMPLPEREATEEAKEIHHEAWNRRADDERV